MKKQAISTLFFIMLGTFSLLAQTIAYDYDAAGNRIARRVVTLRSAMATDGDANVEPVKDIWGERKITVFPNPTKGALKIAVENGEDKALYEAKAFDSNGRVVSTAHQKGNGEMVIDLKVQAPGVYILVLSTGTDEKTYKIVKQ